jgi:hypothetical protein
MRHGTGITENMGKQPFYRKRQGTPQDVIGFFNQAIQDGYVAPLTLTLDHGAQDHNPATLLELVEAKCRIFLQQINREHFFRHRALERLYKKGNKDVAFAMSGVMEKKQRNPHVHFLMRPAAGAVIDLKFEYECTKIWKKIAPLSSPAYFSKYEDGSTPSYELTRDEYRFAIRDGIRKADEGWSHYISKDMQFFGGKLTNQCELIIL